MQLHREKIIECYRIHVRRFLKILFLYQLINLLFHKFIICIKV